MPRKTCPKCGNQCGPRTLVCPDCKHDFKVQKGVAKLNRKRNGQLVDNWHELESGDCIKVLQGSGPYWPLREPKEDGSTREYMGYAGLFKIHHKRPDGFVCYPLDKKNSGACFIYMGDTKHSKIGSVMQSHKIRKVEPKYIDSEARKDAIVS